MSGRLQDGTELGALHRSLRRITEALAVELGNPASATPAWTEFEWSIAPAVASIHGVSPLLAESLRWQGPVQWHEFLRTQREHTTLRHLRILELLGKVHERAKSDGVALVALKGAALHALGVYRPGERPMSDVDLLAGDTESAGHSLERLGYRWVMDTVKHSVWEPLSWTRPADLGEHCDNGIRIELHGRILESLPLRNADISELMLPRAPQPGINEYPSTAALLSHLLLHAAGAMALRSLRLLHLQDIARVAARMRVTDWRELVEADGLDQRLWWAFPPLALTARYFTASIPKEVLTALELSCPWTLRRYMQSHSLTDVSLSSLWVTAFPGIEWAHSPGEVLEYVKLRVWPDRRVRQAREQLADMEPGISGGEWQKLSQSQRVVRWVTSRPARTDTLSAINAALARANGVLRTRSAVAH